MRKITALALSAMLCLSLFAGCAAAPVTEPTVPSNPSASAPQVQPTVTTPTTPEPPVEEPAMPDVVRIAALKGPTAMGLVKLMEDAEDGLTMNSYEFSLDVIDKIVPLISKGEVDIAAVPANLAAVLNKNTDGEVLVLAINTLGVLYVVEKGDTIQSIADLKDKTVFSSGKGAVPEYSFNYILAQNGLNPDADLTVEYKSEHAETIPLLVQGEGGIAVMPQPFVTVAMDKVEGLRIALDLTEEWSKASDGDSSMVTGVMVVRKAFAQKYPHAVAAFLEEYAASTQFAATDVAKTAELVGKQGIVEAAVAEQAIPYCNITYIAGADMKAQLEGYLQVLFEQNPQSVGGVMPGEDFYYIP